MLIKKKYLAILLLPTISFTSLLCNFGEKNIKKYNYDIAKLKIKNNEIYKSYILADENNIYIKDNENEILAIASITKLMTAMIVLDNVNDINNEIVISKYASKVPYGTKIKEKEKYTVEELLKLMLISSTNAASQALSEYVSNDFINLMNEKAKQIGTTTARYCTAHGLPPKYTNTCMDEASAYDIYLITKYAIENYPKIREIVSISEDIIANKRIKNTNELLTKIEGIKGAKTGFHNKAGYNISIFYEKNGKKIYEVILGSDSSDNRSKITKEIIEKFGD